MSGAAASASAFPQSGRPRAPRVPCTTCTPRAPSSRIGLMPSRPPSIPTPMSHVTTPTRRLLILLACAPRPARSGDCSVSQPHPSPPPKNSPPFFACTYLHLPAYPPPHPHNSKSRRWQMPSLSFQVVWVRVRARERIMSLTPPLAACVCRWCLTATAQHAIT
ncbi:uncharacterized protein K452DRAFT_24965 [Aplosporella prunicola CBS 121167]|uniref:Uncharacterized protein n=1 Tax=Aplosporella prunicola CBS 121167 TaxID=1176127 RepID=A0A6A6BD08_9PEZI|nr:uncharacterized protein K452DRAFT_24965 [Aplosporella prunicola CBS 121167]KAF2142030.1 hypothetical protein K452DRAFT_24965 [Aplosporella prunicola CBS 121167]